MDPAIKRRVDGRLSPFAATLLRAARVARLATADEHGAPHVIPICFAFDGRAIYSAIDEKPKRATPRSLRRVRNVMANPRAALVVDHYEEDWGRLRYVLVRGPATILQRGAEHRKAISRLRAKYPQYRSMRLEARPVVKLLPRTIAAWDARRHADRSKDARATTRPRRQRSVRRRIR